MDFKIFVQNVKKFCDAKGVKPTVACRDSGAGKNLLNQVEVRGSVPSVERIQLLAAYLGVTTSDLLGETGVPSEEPSPEHRSAKSEEITADEYTLIAAYRQADERARQMVQIALEPWIPSTQIGEAM